MKNLDYKNLNGLIVAREELWHDLSKVANWEYLSPIYVLIQLVKFVQFLKT